MKLAIFNNDDHDVTYIMMKVNNFISDKKVIKTDVINHGYVDMIYIWYEEQIKKDN